MTTIPRPSAPTDILINFVLDKSGSMGSLQGPTIEGVNAFIAGQRQGQGRALMSLTLFDTSFDVRFVRVDRGREVHRHPGRQPVCRLQRRSGLRPDLRRFQPGHDEQARHRRPVRRRSAR